MLHQLLCRCVDWPVCVCVCAVDLEVSVDDGVCMQVFERQNYLSCVELGTGLSEAASFAQMKEQLAA